MTDDATVPTGCSCLTLDSFMSGAGAVPFGTADLEGMASNVAYSGRLYSLSCVCSEEVSGSFALANNLMWTVSTVE